MKLAKLVLGCLVGISVGAQAQGLPTPTPQPPQQISVQAGGGTGGPLAGASVPVQATAQANAGGAAPSQQWVRVGGQESTFPSPPQDSGGQPPAPNGLSSSTHAAAGYSVAGQPAPTAGATQNGIAPMPPLAPPSNYERAEQIVSPFSNQEIVQLRQRLDDSRKAKAFHPVRTVPRISSQSVDLSPGAALPIARTMPGETTTLVFLDASGAPWPLAAAPRVSAPNYFTVEWLQGTPSVVISARSAYEDGNLTAFLAGLATPVVVKLSTGEPDSKDKSRVVDYRLDLRVPGRGPNAQAPLMGPGKIALYDETMQAFLDGIPPADAKAVPVHGSALPHTQVWQYSGEMFVRTSYDIQTAFDQSVSAGDGTRVFRLPPTPFITLSELGRAVTLQLDIN